MTIKIKVFRFPFAQVEIDTFLVWTKVSRTHPFSSRAPTFIASRPVIKKVFEELAQVQSDLSSSREFFSLPCAE